MKTFKKPKRPKSNIISRLKNCHNCKKIMRGDKCPYCGEDYYLTYSEYLKTLEVKIK